MSENQKFYFRSYWRILSLVGFTLGLLLPWQLVSSDVLELDKVTEVTPIYSWWEIKNSFRSLNHIGNYASQFLFHRISEILLLIGVFSLALYILGNLHQIFLRPSTASDKSLLFLRLTSIFSVLILLPYFIYSLFIYEVSIGYYIITTTIFGSYLLERNTNINWNAKYPYLTAWVGIIVLNVFVGSILFFVPIRTIRPILQVIISFIFYKFLIKRNVLPFIYIRDRKINKSVD